MELTSGVIHAQPQTEISIGGDLVSTYVWRGVYQSGFSLQPEIGLSVGGFTVGVWGSTDLDNFKEGLLHIFEFAFADNRFDFFHDE